MPGRSKGQRAFVDVKLPIEPTLFDEGCDGLINPSKKVGLRLIRIQLARNMVHVDFERNSTLVPRRYRMVLRDALKDDADVEFGRTGEYISVIL